MARFFLPSKPLLLTMAMAFMVIVARGEKTARPGGDLPGEVAIDLVKVGDGFVDPMNVVSPPGESDRLFVIERWGVVRIIQDGEVLDEPFLDLRNDVVTAFLEQGLYDLAFHPNFQENGLFYVHYADRMRNGDSMIVEYKVSSDNPNRADFQSARPVLKIKQPWANHNGGELAFGPDGYLYIGSGDGGWEGDPLEAGQDLSTLLGKILRIDVDKKGARGYGIPRDNPFAEGLQRLRLFGVTEEQFSKIHTDARPEIWAYGIRNPWKFQFDPQTGDLYIADVGQNHWEEINFQPAESDGGENYGWDFKMGTHVFPIEKEKGPDVGVPPIAEYSHVESGICVIGVGVYRGSRYRSLDGIYFAADWGSGRIFGLTRNQDNQWVFQELLDTELHPTGAGQTGNGDLYVTTAHGKYGGPRNPSENSGGAVWRLAPESKVPKGAETAPK